jgi:type II secretory ATPase GspE/PulE/Tfp pilus assembly ATPase PilB-like protein
MCLNIVLQQVFSAVAQPIVDSVLRGYSGTVLAYGPTGSGKTHTMRGPTAAADLKSRAGIIPRWPPLFTLSTFIR